MRYVFQALDAEGYARPLVEAHTVEELLPLTRLGFECRVWDRKMQVAVDPTQRRAA